MEEIWKDIQGYENKYQVSNLGNVRSLNYNNTGQIRNLKPKINRFGFLEVKLSKNNIAKDYMVARLVAETFIENPMVKEIVMRKNTNKFDNKIENLQWAYHSETKHNDYNRGVRKGKPSYTKITYKGKNYKKYTQIAKDLGINAHTFDKRLRLNWGLYEALEIPVGKK